jgi:putative flippase GtrA
MSLVYSLGVLLTFFFNKNWTFQSKASNHRIFRYLLAYCLGYLLNLLILFVLVDHLGYPHQIIQGIAIICIALFLFFVQKAWVFRT